MESGEIVGIGDYDVETKREKRRSLLSQLLADPILADVPRNPALWDVVTSALKKEALCDSPLSNSTAPPWDLKNLIKKRVNEMEQANMGQRHISWKHVWSNFCLSCNNEKLLDDDAVLQDIGVQNKSQVHPYRICSICDEEGSGKTLEEEEASSLLLTPQDLLDSSSRLFPVMKVLVICNGEKMGLPLGLLTMEVLEEPLLYFGHSEIIILSLITRGRGEAIEPSNSSDDRRSTSEVAPQKEVVSFGKRHELTNNYRSVALVNVKLLLPPPYPYHYQG
ncbi:hypothetical protein HID58_087584 [Brassica napus]|uniref:SNRNP25 ubiquitin-like domain-containing protein n=3 Tax=Brassica TaxID=3705 RepID=A0ABQ7XTR5_BRANA|nr:hypothetical protein HID58_087584 [Brassica napus]VDD31852.1 unnamed protein product [Brassica oleracea]